MGETGIDQGRPQRFRAAEREARIRKKTAGSLERYERSSRSLAGGVSSSLRRAARPYPLFFRHGQGSKIVDVDGNTYIDYALAWGPLILGHSHPEVVAAIQRQAKLGLTYGAQHDLEFEVAERLTSIIPCADFVCFSSSGTEIVQVALRLARAATGRLKFLKFEGHYHGWDDSVLVSYHPTREEISRFGGRPIPTGSGQRPSVDAHVVQWNNFEEVQAVFQSHGHEFCAVLCEPLLCNSGCIPPQPGFLELLREMTSKYGVLLIFDEVITGFRLQLEGAQGFYGVIPDLATYAKAVGAGVPLSVLAGKRDFMELIAKGKVVHAGTLNGNPLALAAGRAALDVLADDTARFYQGLWERGERLRQGLEAILRARRCEVVTTGGGPVFQLSFMKERPACYRDLLEADTQLYSDFALALLDEGVQVLPDGRWYLSIAHSDLDIEMTLTAAERAAG